MRNASILFLSLGVMLLGLGLVVLSIGVAKLESRVDRVEEQLRGMTNVVRFQRTSSPGSIMETNLIILPERK